MQITFAGHTIPGRLLRGGDEPPPEVEVVRSKFFGVRGVSEIRGEQGGRMLEFPYLLFDNFASRRALLSYVRLTLNDRAGDHGTLALSDPQYGTGSDPDLRECTFHGAHLDRRNVFPPGNLIGLPTDQSDNGWFCFLTLAFYQLRV